MKKILHAIIFLGLISSCDGQKKTLLTSEQKLVSASDWKVFVSEETGIKANFPCEPEKKIKIWREKPILVRHFNFTCKNNDINFTVSVLEDFDEVSKEDLESNERSLLEEAGKEAKFLRRDNTSRDGFPARYFDVELYGNGRWRQISVARGRTSCKAYVVAMLKPEQKIEELVNSTEEITQRFIDSFHIIEKPK